MLNNVENFYFALVSQGWYLPDLKSQMITFDYLWNVFIDKYYRIKRTDIK